MDGWMDNGCGLRSFVRRKKDNSSIGGWLTMIFLGKKTTLSFCVWIIKADGFPYPTFFVPLFLLWVLRINRILKISLELSVLLHSPMLIEILKESGKFFCYR